MNLNNHELTNRTFDEIQVGDTALISRQITARDIEIFAILSGDINPVHLDPAFAQKTIFKGIIAHGIWGGALISTVLGTQLPGPGTIYLGQTLEFMRPTKVGDIVTATVTVTEKQDKKNIVILDCRCTNQQQEELIRGIAKVMAPTEKVNWQSKILPEIILKNQ
ncbi:MAG: MaoC/PaaZ C-terminal domain-containing protein [Gammaproteobacteria bacterium]